MDRYNIEDSAKRKPLINLLRGWPSPSILPVSLLREASNKVFSDPSIYVPALQYGPDPGYQPLREALAEWLGQTYNVPKRPEEICITGGASQSIACVLASFTDPVHTRAVWAVMPCYYLACPIFADAGFGMVGSKLRGVPEDEEGIDLGWLERSLRECDEAADDKAVSFSFVICRICDDSWLEMSACAANQNLTDIQKGLQIARSLSQALPPYYLCRPDLRQPIQQNYVPPPSSSSRPSSTETRCPDYF